MKNISIYKLLLSLLLLISIISCGDQKQTPEIAKTDKEANLNNPEDSVKFEEVMLTAQQYDALQIKIDTLAKRNMSGYVEANGQLEVPPQNEATITSVIGANVVSIEVIEGDKVNKGQVVAYLSHPTIIQKQTDYLNAHSNSLFLQKEFDRQKKLYDAGVGSGMNFQKAEAEYQAAKSMANGLKAQLKQLNINTTGVMNGTIYQRIPLRTPIEGFVQNVEVKTGQYVEPQKDLFEVVNTHHVHADLMVFEKDVYKIQEGQTVRFNVQSIPDKELKAEIYSISKTFEQSPKALHVHAEIENKEGNLIPGMYIQGKIEVDSDKVYSLPESAFSKDGDKFYVFNANREGEDWSFVPMEVTQGTKDGNWIAVKFLKPIESDAKFAYNNAYYLMAEMKKGNAGHSH